MIQLSTHAPFAKQAKGDFLYSSPAADKNT